MGQVQYGAGLLGAGSARIAKTRSVSIRPSRKNSRNKHTVSAPGKLDVPFDLMECKEWML